MLSNINLMKLKVYTYPFLGDPDWPEVREVMLLGKWQPNVHDMVSVCH